jgi:phosphohistidine phosphatase
MRLYLVQHGEALAAEVDPARPLSAAGAADVRRMAAFLAEAGVGVAAVWHSGKLRAEQTAEILAAALTPGRSSEARAGLDPKDPTEDIARTLVARDQDLMVVGHLPFLAKLASRLVTGSDEPGVVALRPGAVLGLERAERERWTMVWMATPDWFRRS